MVDYSKAITGLELLTKAAVYGIILGIMFAISFIILLLSARGVTPLLVWLIAAAIFSIYPTRLTWLGFKTLYEALGTTYYRYAEFFLKAALIATLAVAVGFSMAILHGSEALKALQASRFTITLISWITGVLIAVFWYKVLSAMSEDFGVDMFKAAAISSLVGALLGFVELASAVLSLVALILYLMGLNKANDVIQDILSRGEVGSSEPRGRFAD